ncbi:MAG: hypothetical protein RIR26_2932 [Pseudomonadota bacterium]|jgi:hypothetical protein
MVTFELPQADVIAVEYVGTAQRGAVSEQQKDVLRQALGALFPTTRTLVDAQELPAGTLAEGIYVRCIQCDANADMSGYSVQIAPAEGKTGLENPDKKQFKISFSNNSKNSQTWLVELGKRRTLWYSSLRWEKITEGVRLEKSLFFVMNCSEEISCPQTTLFSSKEEANTHLATFVGRRLDITKARDLLKREKAISIEKLPFISDVRAQSLVRATYTHRDSTLKIRVNGRSLRNGSLGDIIPVELSAPNFSFQKSRTLDAKVVGEGEVEIVR